MVLALRAFMDFCYLVRCSIIDDDGMKKFMTHLSAFFAIEKYLGPLLFVPPGSLCRGNTPWSTTPSKFVLSRHQTVFAHQSPNRSTLRLSKSLGGKSNKFNALKQMLLTNQWVDKLAAARHDFEDRGMLEGSVLEEAMDEFLRVPNDGEYSILVENMLDL